MIRGARGVRGTALWGVALLGACNTEDARIGSMDAVAGTVSGSSGNDSVVTGAAGEENSVGGTGPLGSGGNAGAGRAGAAGLGASGSGAATGGGQSGAGAGAGGSAGASGGGAGGVASAGSGATGNVRCGESGVPTIGGPPLTTTGAGATGLAAGDLNGDGATDLVILDSGEDTLSVLVGAGNGRFAERVDHAVGARPNEVALGDLDDDGKLDAVVVNRGDSSVSVLLGNGDGGLTVKRDYPAGQGPLTLALGDLNADGKLDVVVGSEDSVGVLMGNGDGSLAADVSYEVTRSVETVRIGDIDGDHLPDVVAASWISTISVLAGNGDGTLAPEVAYAEGSGVIAGALGDLDGTGTSDVVLINSWANTMSVLLSGPDGLVFNAEYATGGHVASDGPYNYPSGTSSPAAVTIADFDADGIEDVVEVNGTSGTVSVLLGRGAGLLANAVDYATGGLPVSLAVADLNGDLVPDIAVTNPQAQTLGVLLGDGDGGFGVEVARTDSRVSGMTVNGVLGDLDGDGVLDLVVAYYDSLTDVGSLQVLFGGGDGHFTPGADYAIDASQSLTLADLDDDGKLDLVTVPNTPLSLDGAPLPVSVLFGMGNGTFASPVDYLGGSTPNTAVLGDLNADGKPDLLVSNLISDSVSVRLGTGGGQFGDRVDYPTGGHASGMSLGDLNGDGKLDLVVANLNYYTIGVLLGIGDGTFAPVDTIDSNNTYSVTLGDMNGDDKLDIVSMYTFTGASLLLGNGDGTFAPEVNYPVGHDPAEIIVTDITGDARPDVLVPAADASSLSVLPGGETGLQSAKLDYATGADRGVWWVAVGDVDGDGRVDLVVPAGSDAVGVLSVCP